MTFSKNTKKMILLANLTALAIVLGIIESYINILGSILPTAKIGLANLVILVVLYLFSFKEALLVNILRVSLTAILSTKTMDLFWIALLGAILSTIVMGVFKKLGVTIVLVSLLGSIAHQFGQSTMLLILKIVSNFNELLSYFYIMFPLGVVAGILNGIIAGNFLKHYDKIMDKSIKETNEDNNEDKNA